VEKGIYKIVNYDRWWSYPQIFNNFKDAFMIYELFGYEDEGHLIEYYEGDFKEVVYDPKWTENQEEKENKMLKQYIRKNVKGQNLKVGVMVAVPISEDEFSIGISKLNPKDEFDRELGETIAVGRALTRKSDVQFPREIMNQVVQFYVRAITYYKDKEYIHIPFSLTDYLNRQ
jgi:hypothetical protein